MVLDLQRRGHRIVLAHPERCPAFQRDAGLLEWLVRAGVLTSITASSFVGRFGGEARRLGAELLRDGLAHNVASDAHDDVRRPPSIVAELEQAGLSPLAEWLTDRSPVAILSGEEIPRARRQLSQASSRPPGRGGGGLEAAHASFVTAMIMPITTNTTIATCIQIHVGDMTS